MDPDHPSSSIPSAPPSTLEATLGTIEPIEGWLSEAQATRLWSAASRVPAGGRIVEIGSFRGRSTVVLATAAPPGVEVVAIDPHAGSDRGPQELRGFEEAAAEDHDVFHANLSAAGVDERVRHVRMFSFDAEPEVAGPIDLLYIDGAHRLGPARDDLRRWGDRVVPGGALLVHDAFSSVGVTLALLSTTAIGSRFGYVGRTASLVELRCTSLGPFARVGNLLRHGAQLPWFGRNLLVKVAILTRLRALARLLGHDGATWPY